MILKLPCSLTVLSSLSCNAASSDTSNPKALIKKQCHLFGAASSDTSSRLTFSIRRRNNAVSCETAVSSSAYSAAAIIAAAIIAEMKEKDAGGDAGRSAADRLRLGSLAEDGLSYKEKFIVRCYEVGSKKTATVDTIGNFLQEAVCNHWQCLGHSPDGFGTTTSMRQLRLIWVAADMHIEISKYPAWNDVVEVESWMESKGRMGIRRHWILKDYATHEVIGRAMCKLVLMNQDTRKYEKVSDDVQKDYVYFCPREPRLSFSKAVKKISNLEDPAQHSRRGLMPRGDDLDMNQHVNNVTYMRWVLESLPQEIIDGYELETISLLFKQECEQDDVVDCHTSPEPFEDAKVSELNRSNGTAAAAAAAKGKEDYCQFLHSLRLSGDGLEITKARTEWRKKPTRRANRSA